MGKRRIPMIVHHCRLLLLVCQSRIDIDKELIVDVSDAQGKALLCSINFVWVSYWLAACATMLLLVCFSVAIHLVQGYEARPEGTGEWSWVWRSPENWVAQLYLLVWALFSWIIMMQLLQNLFSLVEDVLLWAPTVFIGCLVYRMVVILSLMSLIPLRMPLLILRTDLRESRYQPYREPTNHLLYPIEAA